MQSNPKRLVATKGEATLVSQSGFVYLYPEALSTKALYVCSTAEFHTCRHELTRKGWKVK